METDLLHRPNGDDPLRFQTQRLSQPDLFLSKNTFDGASAAYRLGITCRLLCKRSGACRGQASALQPPAEICVIGCDRGSWSFPSSLSDSGSTGDRYVGRLNYPSKDQFGRRKLAMQVWVLR